MPKKRKLESKAPVPLTRGQLSRAQQEQRRIRNLYTAGVAIGTMIVLIVGLAVVNTYFIRPNQEVASVNGVKITRETYNKMRRYNIFQSMQTAAFTSQFGGQTSITQSTAELEQQLRNVDKETTLDQEIITRLQDAEVLRQASSSEFNIAPTTDELREAAIKDYVPQPTPPAEPTVEASPEVTGTLTVTPSATATPTRGSPTATGTPTPTLPPVPGAQQTAEVDYEQVMTMLSRPPTGSLPGPGISEEDYLALIMEPRVRREQVIDKLAATDVMTEVEQIHAQHILTDTKEGAEQLITRLNEGADFSELANEQSKEQIQFQSQGLTPNGGDLGWFPREGSNLVTEFVEGAWPVQAGEYTKEPVQTQFGWHIIKVLERDPSRPLEQSQIETKKNSLYDEWFQRVKAGMDIRPAPPPTVAVPTPAIVEPTPPPAQTEPTPTGEATTPGAPPPGDGSTDTDVAPTPTGAQPPGEAATPASSPPATLSP